MASIETRRSKAGARSFAIKWREGGRAIDPPRTRTLMIEDDARTLATLIKLAGQRWPSDAQLVAHGLSYLVDEPDDDEPAPPPTVADMIGAYLDDLARRPKAPAASSMVKYRRELRLYVAPTTLGKMVAADVDFRDVEEWQALLSSTIAPGGRKPLSVNYAINVRTGLVGPAFRWAASKRSGFILTYNPCADAQSGTPQTTMGAYLETPAEYAILFDEARAIDPDWADLVEASAATGTRWSEIARLRGSQVDVARNRIQLGRSKNGRGRDIPVPVEIMARCIAPRLTGDPDAIVFRQRTGRPWPYSTDHDRWARLGPRLRARGVRGDVTHHALRRGYATWLKTTVGARAAIDPTKVAIVMGHMIKDVTGRHYTGLTNTDHTNIRAAITDLVVPAA